MQVEDRKGMLAQLSASIADINTNILSLEATTGADTHARIDVTVEIKDVKHLEKVIKSLRRVDGVLDVERGDERARADRRAASRRAAMASISTRTSRGSRATCTVARAGYGAVKQAA